MKGEDINLAAVIMAGGAGTRFWPLSTASKPKQFLDLFGDRTLLQRSFDRVAGLIGPDRILVLTNAVFVNLVREQLPQIPAANVIGEPLRRDTAAAVCLGAFLCQRRFGDPVMGVLTADHLIEPVDLFRKTLLSAARQARIGGALYTFGVRPGYPATGYGYLEAGPKLLEDEGIEHFRLLRFKEKPEAATAEKYLTSGNFYWNSGMFVWKASSILDEIRTHLPDHYEVLCKASASEGSPEWPVILAEAFERLETISIDYGVMEKAGEIRCVKAEFSWSDVGGWLALKDFLPRDQAGNSYRGRIYDLDAGDNLVFCRDAGETVMLVGVADLVVVRAGRRTLIARRDRAEEVKKLVQALPEKDKK